MFIVDHGKPTPRTKSCWILQPNLVLRADPEVLQSLTSHTLRYFKVSTSIFTFPRMVLPHRPKYPMTPRQLAPVQERSKRRYLFPRPRAKHWKHRCARPRPPNSKLTRRARSLCYVPRKLKRKRGRQGRRWTERWRNRVWNGREEKRCRRNSRPCATSTVLLSDVLSTRGRR